MSVLVFCFCAVATVVAAWGVYRSETVHGNREFERLTQHLGQDVEVRLSAYLQLGQSAAGLLNTGTRLDRREWTAFVQGLLASRSEAGFQTLGLAFRDEAGHFPLSMVVPEGTALETGTGKHLGADETWRAAIELARDRGQATLSGLISLDGEGKGAPALAVVAPFYLGGTPGDIQRRREQLAGVVAVVIRIDRLVDAVLDDDAPRVDLTLADRRLSSVANGAGLREDLPRHDIDISVGGHPWRLQFTARPAFLEHVDHGLTLTTVLIGVIVTLLATAASAKVRSRGDRSVREAKERYREFLVGILDTLPEPIVVKTADQRIAIVNQAYAQWVGSTVDKIVGHQTHEFFPPEIASASVALDHQILADGKPREIELLIADQRRGGELRNVVVRKMLGRSTRGEPLVVGIHQDVTEVRRSEARFRQLTELSSDWYWEQDAELRFTMLAGRQWIGSLMPQSVVGKYRWDLPIDWSEAQWAEHRATLAARQPFRDVEYRMRVSDGEPQWFSISGEPVFDIQGRFTGYRGVGRNISGRHRAEEELRRHRDHLAELVEERTADLLAAKNAAEAASNVKSEFLANMSHELRTPLHAILSFARLGQGKDDDPDKAQRYFARIIDAGERLLVLVNDLLDLSKMEAGKMRYDLKPADLIQLIHGAAFEFEAMIEERGLRLELPSAARQVPAQIDAPRFAQVLRNLLSNAIKFSEHGGRVVVRVTEGEMNLGRRASDSATLAPAWRIEVMDEGVGIPESEVEAVFDKFNQSTATRTGAGGTGLGLAICREIVAAHRGTIVARNRPEGGAVFEILVPR